MFLFKRKASFGMEVFGMSTFRERAYLWEAIHGIMFGREEVYLLSLHCKGGAHLVRGREYMVECGITLYLLHAFHFKLFAANCISLLLVL